MKRIFVTLMLLLIMNIVPAFSRRTVYLRITGSIPNGMMRVPSRTSVSADYDDGILSINVSGYTGIVSYSVCDENGVQVASSSTMINGNGSDSIDLDGPPQGTYTLYITVGDTVYVGMFDI